MRLRNSRTFFRINRIKALAILISGIGVGQAYAVPQSPVDAQAGGQEIMPSGAAV